MKIFNSSSRYSKWLQDFYAWVAEPSPSDSWVYRGQAARYKTIIPSIARSTNSWTYGNRLFEIDSKIARELLQSSPILNIDSLYPHQPKGISEIQFGVSAQLFAGIPEFLPYISFSELIRALAQHYGFPTGFIDLTMDPIVAAFFATHQYKNGEMQPNSDEEAIIYRWPAIDESYPRIKLITSLSKDNLPLDTISGFNLTDIHPAIRRPNNQLAVLAKPFERPFEFIPPETWKPVGGRALSATPLDEMKFVDLSKVSTCQSFKLPPNFGNNLVNETGVSYEAMFPDQIDLGYSYINVIALLSIIAHDPDSWGVDRENEPGIAKKRKNFRKIMQVADKLLHRECYRIVPDSSIPRDTFHNISITEIKHTITYAANVAKQAAIISSRPEVYDDSVLRDKIKAATSEFIQLRIDVLKQTLLSLGYPVDETNFELEWKRGNLDWVPNEIDKRLYKVNEIISYAENVPIYAVFDPKFYQRLIEIFPSSKEYKLKISTQFKRENHWLKIREQNNS